MSSTKTKRIRWNYITFRFLFVMLFLLSSGKVGLAEKQAAALQLTLPTEFYSVVGQQMSLYYDNIVLTQTPVDYRFKVACDIGKAEKERWTVTPGAADTGDHRLQITVSDSVGKQLAQGSLILRVTAADAGAKEKIRLLIVGDSLTHATLYPNEIARLLSQSGNPDWKMLGTHQPKSAAEGVAHEGYGGWTWQRFASHYEPNPDGTYRKRSSPFVYLGANGKPALDVNQYFEKECGGERPDFVLFMLGINDCFGANPESPTTIDPRVSTMLKQADLLIAAFQKSAPDAELGICLTTPPNSREAGFEANYKGRYTRWGWKRIQHRLVQRQLKHFAGREKERLFVVPTELNLDPTGGYPTNNGVHPNQAGYQQIGGSMVAWLKARLADQEQK